MATLNLTIKDAVYAQMLATFDGVDDAERLTAMKKYVRQNLKERVITQRTREAIEASNAALRDTLATLDVALAE